jgi:SAM-dependent methyltransferase
MTDELVEAVFDDRLAPAVADVTSDRAVRLAAVCRRIGDRVDRERDELIEVLTRHAIEVEPAVDDGQGQRHTVSLWVRDVGEAERAARLLLDRGWEPWQPWPTWERGAAESFRRTADRLVLARTADVTIVVRVRWAAERRRSRRGNRLLRPSSEDWNLVELPTSLWRAYPAVRITRLLAEWAGLRGRSHGSIGPFLSTPDSLIGPLLDFAGIGDTDTLVDIGCGDGRVPVAAAACRGASAIGVDHAPELIERARRRAESAGVADRVELVVGDARAVDLAGVTVAFMFLPVGALAQLLPQVRRRLAPGSRIIIHEQNRLPTSLRPDTTALLASDDALTVAHRFDVR